MNKQIEDTLLNVARKTLGIETLDTRHSDRLDFHDTAVWCIKDALAAAFQAGTNYATKPIVVVIVRGGLVEDVNATSPVRVFVEDWDCPERPLVMDFESGALTPNQARRVAERLADINHSDKE
jgi:hypothetical protein